MFKDIFNKSQVKIELERLVLDFFNQNQEYKFYNIEIGLYHAMGNFSSIKANLKTKNGDMIGDFNSLTFEIAKKTNLIYDLKNIISDHQLKDLPHYVLLLEYKSELKD